jgi:hypothetical protein
MKPTGKNKKDPTTNQWRTPYPSRGSTQPPGYPHRQHIIENNYNQAWQFPSTKAGSIKIHKTVKWGPSASHTTLSGGPVITGRIPPITPTTPNTASKHIQDKIYYHTALHVYNTLVLLQKSSKNIQNPSSVENKQRYP